MRKILLIDDNPADNYIHTHVLKSEDFVDEVIAIESGQEALDYLKSVIGTDEIPELVFLDINMPGMDGWEFLEEYHKIHEQLKGQVMVIMLSTSLNPEDEKKARRNKLIQDFINKPLDRKVLAEIVQNHFS